MSGIPMSAFSVQEQMELTLLNDGGTVSVDSLRTFTLPRAEYRMSMLEKELELNQFSFGNTQKIRRRIDRLEAALDKLHSLVNPSLVGSVHGGPTRQESGADEMGLTKCRYPACEELIDREDRFQRGGACQSCWNTAAAVNTNQIGE